MEFKAISLEEREFERGIVADTYPSLCYSCKNARRVVNEENGYVGCVAPMKHYKDFHLKGKNVMADSVGRGVIDLHAKPFMMPSSSGTSNQLITRCTIDCPYYNI